MDLPKFLQSLSRLNHDRELPGDQLPDLHWQTALEQTGSSTSIALMQVLNLAVGCLAAEEIYCEVGCLPGATLIAALANHPEQMAYAIADPASVQAQPQMLDRLTEHLAQFNLQEQIYFCCQNFEEFFADWREAELTDRIGVYFYNGASDYRSLMLGLLLAKSCLAEQALILIRQDNSEVAQQAIWDFLAAHAQVKWRQDLMSIAAEKFGLESNILILEWDATSTEFNASFDWQAYRHPQVIQAIYDLPASFEIDVEALCREAVQLHVQGQLDAAEQMYKQILQHDSNQTAVWQQLGMLYYLKDEFDAAIVVLHRAIELNSQDALPYQILGLCLEQKSAFESAIAAYQQALTLKPDYTDALNRLGELLAKQGAFSQAEALYRRAIAIDATQISSYISLGDVLLEQKQFTAAIDEYRKALEIQRQNPYLWEKFATAHEMNGNLQQAQLYNIYALYYHSHHEEAIEQFRQLFTIKDLDTVEGCFILYNSFYQCSDLQAATSCLDQVSKLRPDDQFLQIASQLILPIVYQAPEEIEQFRQRYQQALEQISHQVEQATLQSESINIDFIRSTVPFYLANQGRNDRPILELYGKLLHGSIADKYPDLAQPVALPAKQLSAKIRIGYVANSLKNDSANRWAVGWLKHHDRSQFEIYCYSIESDSDFRTDHFKLLSDSFSYLPANDLEAAAQQIRADQLDILVFLAIGNRPKVANLAATRLAPIQCSAWGHPVTSGLPTIDYFLSGDLMEPENAQDHYTEKLVRLPNLGICYPQPVIPAATKTRADFGIREDAVVYLSCQLIFKYLPQHDYLLPEIIRRVPQAQIVFVLRSTAKNQVNPSLERQFRQRLSQAFARVGLNMDDHCLFLRGQDWSGYTSLLRCVDAFLDTLEFSGGHTTFDAIACNLPIVTHAGQLMRGRQSYGMLSMLGVTETIAQSEAEYLEIAVRLGLEPDWRQTISQRMSQRQNQLFDDTTCVQGLEQFYQQVVQAKQTQVTDGGFVDRAPQPENVKSILHVGCGPYHPQALPDLLRTPEWREVRLDIDPAVQPDIIGSITDMHAVLSASVDAVYSSHNLEHVYAHEVPIALAEFYRVLKPGGFALIIVPDIQKVAEYVAQGKLEEPLYVSPYGPIAAIDILYGFRTALAQGNHFMAHRTAFTVETLRQKLQEAGFSQVEMHKEGFNLCTRGYK